MAMTNDIGLHSLMPAASAAAPRKYSEQDKASQAKEAGPNSSVDGVRAASFREEQQPEASEMEQTVEDLNGLVQDLQRQVRFSLDDDSGEMVVTVVDRETDDVIRQIPAEDVLQLRERLEQATGAIFKGRA